MGVTLGLQPANPTDSRILVAYAFCQMVIPALFWVTSNPR